jgi:hypothetical protein
MGGGIAALFRKNLPDLILSLLSIFIGLFAYCINVFMLSLFNITITRQLMVIISTLEIILLYAFVFYRSRLTWQPSLLFYPLAGGLFILLSWFFLNNIYTYATPDSLYMVVMAKGILENGFSQWYLAGPLSWGLFIPLLQTLGMLFGYDYTWFIQPVMSFIFIILYILIVHRASSQLTSRKWLPLLLALLGTGLLLSTNIYWASQFYIHANLMTGITLFLTLATIYLAIVEKKDEWLSITSIFFIMFGLMRVENFILASLIVILLLATQKFEYKKMLRTFLPYLIFQLGWDFVILWMKPETFTNILSTQQLILIIAGLIGVIITLLISNKNWFIKSIIENLQWITSILLIGLIVSLFFFNPNKIANNIWTILQQMLSGWGRYGLWFLSWLVIMVITLLLRTKKPIPLQRFFYSLIVWFFVIILFLGMFRGRYHVIWSDSANRMLLHIFPTILFVIILQISQDQIVSFLDTAEPSVE